MENLLCPCRALKYYLERTRGVQDRPKTLFVSPTKMSKAITKNAISYFVKELLTDTGALYETTSPIAHSIRGVGTSLALKLNVSIDKILEAATWKRTGVFQMHYLKEFALTYDNFSSLGPIVSAGQIVQMD